MLETPEEEEVPEQLAPGEIARQNLVLGESGIADPDYRVGAFELPPTPGSEVDSVPIICISEVDNDLLVAVPSHAWHRTVASRILPARALYKPVLVSFAAVLNSDRHTTLPDINIKAWLAYLRPEFEKCLDFETPGSEIPPFSLEEGASELLPAAEALVQIAEDKFNFLSAASGGAEEPEETAQRLARLEESVIAIRSSLVDLTKQRQPRATTSMVQPTAKTGAKAPKANAPKSDLLDDGLQGLDPEVVAAARNAGIETSHLQEFARMIQPKKNVMKDLPRGAAEKAGKKRLDVLGDSEEEDDPEGGEAEASPSEPVVAALLKLTKIVDRLSDTKRQKGKLLADAMDEAGVSGDSFNFNTGSLSSKRNAQVLRVLKKALRESPLELYEAMKQKMFEDCGSPEIAPGSGAPTPSFRGWCEHRSRIPNLNGTVRTVWAVGGALDALDSGKTDEAKARLLLYLASLDQVAIDRGSWVLANAGSLEDAPPFASFGKHVLPDYLEPQHTKLWPPVWADAFMHQIREQDEFLDRKSKLGKRQGGGNQNVELTDAGGKGAKGKKGKSKEQQKGGNSEAAGAASSSNQ